MFLKRVESVLTVRQAQLDWSFAILKRAVLGTVLLLAGPAPVISQLTVERTIFLSATGTGPENCTALRNVLDSLPVPTADQIGHHIKIGPGLYDCGTDTVSIPASVEIEGSGSRTVIVGRRESSIIGVVDFDRVFGARLRSVRVQNFGADPAASKVAISAFGANVDLDDVFVLSPRTGTPGPSIGLLVIPATGFSGFVRVRNSTIDAKTAAKTTGTLSGPRLDFHSTQIVGLLDTSSVSVVNCGGCYDQSFTPLDSTCSPPPP